MEQQETNYVQSQGPINPQLPQKNLHPKIWISILVAGAFIVGYLVWANASGHWPFEEKYTSNQSPINNTAKSETNDWEIFHNEKYGFEFKYPDNKGLGYLHIEGGGFMGALSDQKAQDWVENLLIGTEDGPPIMYIQVRNNEYDYQISLGKNSQAGVEEFQNTYKASRMTLNGTEFTKYEGGNKATLFNKLIYATVRNVKYFILKIDETSDVAKSILFSFKFLEPVAVETYLDDEYNFRLQYPAELTFGCCTNNYNGYAKYFSFTKPGSDLEIGGGIITPQSAEEYSKCEVCIGSPVLSCETTNAESCSSYRYSAQSGSWSKWVVINGANQTANTAIAKLQVSIAPADNALGQYVMEQDKINDALIFSLVEQGKIPKEIKDRIQVYNDIFDSFIFR